MNPRRAARELALLTLYQMDTAGTVLPSEDAANNGRQLALNEMILSSVRVLTGEAEFQVQSAASQWADVSRYLQDLEMEHPVNLNSPIDAPQQPVPIPTTRAMIEKIEECLHSAELVFEALRLPELVSLARQEDVQKYASKLVELVLKHRTELDEQLNRHMTDWRMDRLHRMDAFILRLAAAEMRFARNVDLSISINEAVDLAKQFSNAESFRLINGILGSLAIELAESTGKNLHRVYHDRIQNGQIIENAAEEDNLPTSPSAS